MVVAPIVAVLYDLTFASDRSARRSGSGAATTRRSGHLDRADRIALVVAPRRFRRLLGCVGVAVTYLLDQSVMIVRYCAWRSGRAGWYSTTASRRTSRLPRSRPTSSPSPCFSP